VKLHQTYHCGCSFSLEYVKTAEAERLLNTWRDQHSCPIGRTCTGAASTTERGPGFRKAAGHIGTDVRAGHVQG